MRNLFRYFNSSPEVIRLTVMMPSCPDFADYPGEIDPLDSARQ